MRILIACASAVALAVGVPALAQGNGNGNSNRGGANAQAERGGGPQGGADRNNRGRAEMPGNRGGGNANRGDGRNDNAGGGNANRGNGNANHGGADRSAQRPGNGGGNANRGNQDQGNGRAMAQGNDRGRPDNPGRGNARNADRGPAIADRGRGNGQGNAGRGNAPRDLGRIAEIRETATNRARGRAQMRDWRDRDDDNDFVRRAANIDFYRERRWDGGDWRDRLSRVRNLQRTGWQSRFCPPGLAQQNRLCMPPGQYRKLYNYGSRFDRRGYEIPDWFRSSYRDNPFLSLGGNLFGYRYANGYAYRLDPETQLVSALLPILGGALGLGQTLPTGYNLYNLPMQYRPIYRDDDYLYRYADNAIFRVDPTTRRIMGISELVSDPFVVGQRLPSGYGTYNVPYGYRSSYYDTNDYLYRYNAGRIYQVDPETRLILAAIDLFT